MSGMWVVVYANEGTDQGLVFLCRELAPDERLTERTFADAVAAERHAIERCYETHEHISPIRVIDLATNEIVQKGC